MHKPEALLLGSGWQKEYLCRLGLRNATKSNHATCMGEEPSEQGHELGQREREMRAESKSKLQWRGLGLHLAAGDNMAAVC